MMVSPTGADIALSLEQMNAIKDDVQHYLDGHVEELKRDGIEAEGVIVNGKAGPAIIDYSVANNADMIAIVTHGRSGIGKAVYGSVADYVLKNSGIPTLVFKPKDN
jgi:nucleotide-binding universal stress UspA family protein